MLDNKCARELGMFRWRHVGGQADRKTRRLPQFVILAASMHHALSQTHLYIEQGGLHACMSITDAGRSWCACFNIVD